MSRKPKRSPKASTPRTTTAALSRIPTHTIESRSLRLVLRVTGFLLLGLVLFGWMQPEWRTWGFHHLAFLPLVLAVLLAALSTLLWSPIGSRLVGWLFRHLQKLSGQRALLWAAIAAAFFFLFRVSIPLMGDGPLWIKELAWIGEFQARGDETPPDRWKSRKEPLEIVLHEMVYRVVTQFRPTDSFTTSAEEAKETLKKREKWFDSAARSTYMSLSILAGALTILMVLQFARRRITPRARSQFLLTLFTGGGILLFFGYIEHYSWVSFAMIAFLMAGVDESFTPRRFPWKTILAFVVAVGCHLTAIILLPALLYLLFNLYKWKSDEKKSKDAAPRKRVFTFLAAFALLGLAGYFHVKGWKGWLSVLPLVSSLSPDGYAFFSLKHVIDLLNLFVLIALPAMVILAVLRAPKKVEHILQIQSGFLAVAAISGVAFVVAFNPNLGMARDWDVLAVALWPLLFFAAWKMACTDLGTLRAELLAFVVGFTCVISIPFILVQTGEGMSIACFETLLHMDASRSAYGWENLAVHYESTGDLDGRIRAWKGAVEASNNPRYMINYANVLRMADRLDEAEVYSIRGARLNPEYAYQLTHIATAYALRDNFEKARELLALAVELDSTDSRARRLLQRTEWEIARRDSMP